MNTTTADEIGKVQVRADDWLGFGRSMELLLRAKGSDGVLLEQNVGTTPKATKKGMARSRIAAVERALISVEQRHRNDELQRSPIFAFFLLTHRSRASLTR
jgi:hypothetical protein